MISNDKTFEWTDALVQEFCDSLQPDTYAEMVEINNFKESKKEQVIEQPIEKPMFEEALRALINSYSLENGNNTPDYILAQYLSNCYSAYDKAVKSKDKWHTGTMDETYFLERNIPIQFNTNSNEQTKNKKEDVKDKDFEILSFRMKSNAANPGNFWVRGDNGNFAGDGKSFWATEESMLSDLGGNSNKEIYSVKRKSDGVIFSIGDKVGFIGVIESISINSMFDGGIALRGNSKNICIGTAINISRPTTTPSIPLFTTEDGVKMFDGETAWHISILEGSWRVSETIVRPHLSNGPSYFKYFSTEEKAKEYITLNKPCLSLNDLLDVWDEANEFKQPKNSYAASPMFNSFKEKAKQKLNN